MTGLFCYLLSRNNQYIELEIGLLDRLPVLLPISAMIAVLMSLFISERRNFNDISSKRSIAQSLAVLLSNPNILPEEERNNYRWSLVSKTFNSFFQSRRKVKSSTPSLKDIDLEKLTKFAELFKKSE